MQIFEPKRIVASEKVANPETLLEKFPLQIQLYGKGMSPVSDGGYVILDFGRELSGGIRIFTTSISENGKIHIRFGESVGETCSNPGYKGFTNDHSTRDFEVIVPCMSDMTFGNTGFRFVRVDFHGDVWNLRNIVAVSDADTRTEVGYFKCNDELVNTIWRTASYTLRLNLHNGYFWDGVKRDRLVWIGDTYPEMKAALCLYADTKEIRNTLQFTVDENMIDGWMDGMSTYDLWWLLIVADAYKETGDRGLVRDFRSQVLTEVNKFLPYVQEDGTITLPCKFIDWPSSYNEGEPIEKMYDSDAGTSYLMKLAFRKIRDLYAEFGGKDIVETCDLLLSRLAKRKDKVLKYKQIAALGVAVGEKDKNKEDVLMAGGAKGLSTFQSYFILSAVAAYGHYEEALQMLKDYYGGMLSVGATTFWEDFDMEWLENASRIDELPVKGKKDIHGDYGKYCYIGYRHSFCHGWSSGVIPYLVENVVGLKAKDNLHYVLEPHLSGLTDVECDYPTEFGVIHVEHHMKDGKLETIVEKPEEVTVSR